MKTYDADIAPTTYDIIAYFEMVYTFKRQQE